MKKLLFVFAIAVFAACNSGSETPANSDSPAVTVDTAAKAVDTAAVTVDTTATTAPEVK